ncbi:MAG: hypothetical protein ACFB14_02460 [Leptolyngbyaceae cyanobacterium]
MTSQKDQIQRLIAEIDATLAKPSSRLPLGLSGDSEQQRQLLGKLFNYLQSLDQMFESPGGWGPINPDTGQFVSPSASEPDMEESAAQVLQGLLTEMKYLRENSLRPMRQELESLQQKRDSLQAEINVLEAQRVAEPSLQSEQQINAFLETLMQRLQEKLSAQMVQNFATMEAAAMEQMAAADNPAPMMSGQRLEQVRLLQAQSDQLLLKLDSTLTAVFDSLQKSVDSYRESLEEGLDHMHGLGRQGEVIFHAFINHLAQQLGQDASLYLATGLGESDQPSALQEQPDSVTADVDLDAIQLDELDQALEDLSLENEAEAVAEAPLEVDADLSELELLEQAIAPDEDITLIQANDLSELELLEDEVAPDEDITLIQADTDLGEEIEFDLDEAITLIQDDEPDLGFLDEAIDDDDGSADAFAQLTADAESESPPVGAIADDESTQQNLDLSLDDIDENLGLLAVGSENSELLSLDELNDGAPDQGELPQESGESELFNFDVDFDLGLEPIEEDDDSTADLLVGSLFLDDPKATEDSSNDFLDLNLELTENDANEPDASSLTTDVEAPAESVVADSDLIETANQVADAWLFEQTGAEVIDDNVIPEATVESLFGDIASGDELENVNQPEPEGDVVVSLSEVLPDDLAAETVEEFPENVPDDVYIAAAADEDLINLVQPDAEQRLLINFDDEQLVEQLDEDLQKLAGDTFATDYGVEEDDTLEPLDQATLETIVRDLNLESLDLESGQSDGELEPEMTDESKTEQDEDPFAEPLQSDDEADSDLFEGFAAEVVDVDDPSSGSEEIDIATVTSLTETELESNDVDLLGLVADPLLDDFEDGLTDSLADELGGLNAQSNALSQQPADQIVGQILSDLEEPVVPADEAVTAPVVEDTEPGLDSSSLPDLPADFLVGDPGTVSPEADDFLQAEQDAFWQTMTEDERSQSLDNRTSDILDIVDLLNEDEPVSDASNESAPPDDLGLDAASVSAADDLEDLLGLDDLPTVEPVEDSNIDLGDLDELFGQSPLPELEALDQGDSSFGDAPVTDPLTALGLDVTAPMESLPETSPEALIPNLIPETDTSTDVSVPMAAANVEATITDPVAEPVVTNDGVTNESVTDPPVTDTPIDVSVDVGGDWFLGLDVGSTGLSAVLMDRQTGQVYPLYWQKATEEAKHFRLPAMALMTSAQETIAVGYDALGDLGNLDAFGAEASELIGVNRLKPLLKVAVGHGQTLANSDPWVRWSDTVELPMLQILQAMVTLLKYVKEQGQAVGLDNDSLKQIWEKLQGVVVGYPTNWPDTYSFNLREAVLAAELIDQPEQILFVEDAIATILSGLPDPNNAAIAETVSLSRQPSLYNCQWQEGTVVISGGAVMTELGLVDLPKKLTNLNYADFALRGFAYAGDALDQDIVCQLLLPEERRQPLTEADASISWDWQGHLAAEDADWGQLNLDGLTLPAVGHVDWSQRYQLQQRLLKSSLGQGLLAAARHLKLALQQQNQMQLTLAGQHWLIKRRHLENLIFLPYIQRINRYLNVLLSHHSIDSQAIKQVVCSGGSASLPAIARWLRQKFPNATIIQDTYASELPHSCSRVAYGLVNLARYPQVLNITRQQYSDYFLLMELLRVFPQQPLPVGAIMHLLEQRGINTQACHLHILALLEGHLPPGLVPTAADRGLICDRTTDLPTYRALLQTPLFTKTVTESGGQMYIPNEAQAEQLRAYVSRILINKVQTLEEPLIAHLEVFA